MSLSLVYLCSVFLAIALEKLVYVIAWLWWQFHHAAELPSLFQTAPLTALFFTLYGP